MNTTTKSKLTPETDAERNVRVLSNRACAARNAANAAEGTDTYEALSAVADEAQGEWNQARIALIIARAGQ